MGQGREGWGRGAVIIVIATTITIVAVVVVTVTITFIINFTIIINNHHHHQSPSTSPSAIIIVSQHPSSTIIITTSAVACLTCSSATAACMSPAMINCRALQRAARDAAAGSSSPMLGTEYRKGRHEIDLSKAERSTKRMSLESNAVRQPCALACQG